MGIRQQALTVVASIRADLRASDGTLKALAARLDAIESDVQDALPGVKSLHFARFVMIDGPLGPSSRLALETNHDGERPAHVAELQKVLAPWEDLLFGSWDGYRKGDLAGFVERNALPASTFYLSHPGLAVGQILNDEKVRALLETLLDQEVAAQDVTGDSAVRVRDRLLARLAKLTPESPTLVVGHIDRGLPSQPAAKIRFWTTIVPPVVVIALSMIPLVLFTEWRERQTDLEKNPELIEEDAEKLDPINRREDTTAQNGLTHHVAMRPGKARRFFMTTMLWFLEQARSKIAFEGTLGDIESIHFARWVMLDDDTVLFFSNYDGSWESYLGDFVDKAHNYLTAVWTNTKWFPRTDLLILGGASKELMFKRWVRTFQIENRIWYSAYRNLSVGDVLRNARVREGASGTMTEEDAKKWLAEL